MFEIKIYNNITMLAAQVSWPIRSIGIFQVKGMTKWNANNVSLKIIRQDLFLWLSGLYVTHPLPLIAGHPRQEQIASVRRVSSRVLSTHLLGDQTLCSLRWGQNKKGGWCCGCCWTFKPVMLCISRNFTTRLSPATLPLKIWRHWLCCCCCKHLHWQTDICAECLTISKVQVRSQ